jgi:hypothetical protein
MISQPPLPQSKVTSYSRVTNNSLPRYPAVIWVVGFSYIFFAPSVFTFNVAFTALLILNAA